MLVFTLTPGPVRSIVSHVSNKLDSDAAGSPIFSFVLPAHVCSYTTTLTNQHTSKNMYFKKHNMVKIFYSEGRKKSGL